jgi:MSHA pilin protein MshD
MGAADFRISIPSLRSRTSFDFRFKSTIGNRKSKIPQTIRPEGFTLVEAVVSLIIVATMLVAALSTVGASRLSQQRTSQYNRGQLLAESLMAEILAQDYLDPNDTPVFGTESGESTTTRADFDDVDDYHGWSSSPPVEKDGTLLSGLTGWQRSVTVEWVNPDDPGEVKAFETGAKRITVTVSCGNKQVGFLVAIRTNSGL